MSTLMRDRKKRGELSPPELGPRPVRNAVARSRHGTGVELMGEDWSDGAVAEDVRAYVGGCVE